MNGRYFSWSKLSYSLLVCLFTVTLHGAEKDPDKKDQKPGVAASVESSKEALAEKLSVTHHEIKIHGKTLQYTATAGYLQIKDEQDKSKARLFFIAYEKKTTQDQSERPITFAFNGGPGASSVFLHLGAIGPKRVMLPEQGTVLPASTQLVTNDYTWLEFTDLVFIDPVGSGYSRPAPGIDPKQFYSVEEDTRLAGEFIRLYTTQHNRWLSPKFIAGESYGSTRAAALSGYLQTTVNMNLNGLLLISPALNFQTMRFAPGNDLPCILFLPAYTASAWYHKKLPPELQTDLTKTLQSAELWAQDEYAHALLKGDELTATDKDKINDKLAYYTGLSRKFIKNSNLRINQLRFVKELLRDEQRTIGVLDSRVKGIDADSAGEYSEFDPALFLVTGPYSAAINDYLRKELHYETDLSYEVLNLKINREWNWGSASQGYVNVTETLRQAMSQNRYLQVFIACGYYDLATPYYAAKYTVCHLGLDPGLRNNIQLHYYDAGHQMYTNLTALKKLTGDASDFIKKDVSKASN